MSDLKCPPGWRVNERLSRPGEPCWTCERCEANCGYQNGLESHVCWLPVALGKHLYFHEVPERWPYASKGHTSASVPSLAEWLNALPATFREELLGLLRKD